MIGLGKECVLYSTISGHENEEGLLVIEGGGITYFENMIFDFTQCVYMENTILTLDDAELHINKCKFKLIEGGIDLGSHSSLNIKDSVFEGGKKAIDVWTPANEVTIINNIFRHNSAIETEDNVLQKYGCIQVNDVIWDGEEVMKPNVKLICDGNVFENISCYPIMEYADGWDLSERPIYTEMTHLYSLQNNTVKGCRVTVTDANQMYCD